MTTIFYRRPLMHKTTLRPGKGNATPPETELTAQHGGVLLAKDGVRVNGKLISECTLFHGEPARLLSEQITLESIRGTRFAHMLPATYIDQSGSVCEGKTGRVIFKA